MGKFNTRQGLSSLANSDIFGQFSVQGGGASIPFLVDGATNRILTLSDTNSGSVFLIKDADGNEILNGLHNGLTVGGSYTLPLTDGSDGYVLKTNGSGVVTWDSPFAGLTVSALTDVDDSPFSTAALHGAILRYNVGASSNEWVADGPYSGFSATRQTGTVTKGTPVKRTGSSNYGQGLNEVGVGSTDNNSRCIGIACADHVSNKLIVLTDGIIGGMDTSAFSNDDVLYVSNTTGQLTNTAPTSGLYQQRVARVIDSDATEGIIQVTVDPAFDENSYLTSVGGQSVGDLSNVNTSGAAAGNVLRYDGSDWVDSGFTIPTNAFAPTAGTAEVLKVDSLNVTSFGTIDIGDLADVDVATTAPTTNDVLQYNGSDWVPAAASSTSTPDLDTVLGEGNTSGEDVTVGGLTVSNTDVGTSVLATTTDDSASNWVGLNIYRNSSSPADNDIVGSIAFNGMNDGSSVAKYGEIRSKITDASDGDEESDLIFYTQVAGAQHQALRLHDGGAELAGSVSADIVFATSTDNSSYISSSSSLNTPVNHDAFKIGRTYASVNDGQPIGALAFEAFNDAFSYENFARITGVTIDVSDGSEDGMIRFATKVNGTDTTIMDISGAGVDIGAFTLPLTDGSANQVLTTDGSGAVTWEDGGGTVADIADIGNVTVSGGTTNEVLVYNQISQTWSNGSAPVPTLAQVTASGATTSSTITLGAVLQTGSTTNVAASGNSFSQFRATNLQVGTGATMQYAFPTSDGNAGEVLTTDGSGGVTFEAPSGGVSQTFFYTGSHQLTTSTDTNYRYPTNTSFGGYGSWNRSTATIPSSQTLDQNYMKAAHIVTSAGTYDIQLSAVNCITTSTTGTGAATEYNNDAYNIYLYKWTVASTGTLLGTISSNFQSSSSDLADDNATFSDVTLAQGDILIVVSKCATNASTTRYWHQQYTLQLNG